MLLKFKAFLLSVSAVGANAKRSYVAHSSGRKHREAKQAQRVLAKGASQGSQESSSGWWSSDECTEYGEGCGWWNDNCCDGTVCGGLLNRECYHDPALEGEYCNFYYPCDEDLLCYEGTCYDYADMIDYGSYEGTCAEGSGPGELTVMTYNTFLLDPGIGGGTFNNPLTGEEAALWGSIGVPSQDHDQRELRVARMMEWVKTRDEDVIAFQELYTFREKITAGMVAAGFCHYAVTPFGQFLGDGTAIFSKFPITEVDFWDFYDVGGKNSMSHPASAAALEMMTTDRGVMLAKIAKDGNKHNILNTHTVSDSTGDQHVHRLANFLFMREIGDALPSNESVFYVGDMNEDKYTFAFGEEVGDDYYQAMLRELEAIEPEMTGDNQYSYDCIANPLPALFQSVLWQQLLDYVLVSTNHLQPSSSSCEIPRPVWPEDCGNDLDCQVSDHYPVTCTFSFNHDKGTSEEGLTVTE